MNTCLSIGRRLCVVVATSVVFTGTSIADYDLSWFTTDGGGAMWTTGGDLELSGTIGQPDAGVVLTGGGFELVGGFWALPTSPVICVGDLNCDGTIGFGDINPLVLYLSNNAIWLTTYPGCDPRNGDINCDGTFGQGAFGDINPFVALMTQCGQGCACPGPIACP